MMQQGCSSATFRAHRREYMYNYRLKQQERELQDPVFHQQQENHRKRKRQQERERYHVHNANKSKRSRRSKEEEQLMSLVRKWKYIAKGERKKKSVAVIAAPNSINKPDEEMKAIVAQPYPLLPGFQEIHKDESLRALTHCRDHCNFEQLYAALQPEIDELALRPACRRKKQRKVDGRNCLLLTLNKLCENRGFKPLAVSVGISRAYLQQLYRYCIELLYAKLVPQFFSFDHERVIAEHTTQLATDYAECVLGETRNVLIVCGDTSHVQIGLVNDEHLSGKYRDQKHKMYAVKFFLCCASDGLVLYPPDIDFATTSDQALFKRSPLLKELQPGDIVFLDGGFQLPMNEVQRERLGIPSGVHVVQPPRRQNGQPFSCEQAELKQIADAIRAVIENVFGKMKEYKILAQHYPIKSLDLLPKVIMVVCAIILFNMKDRDHFLRKIK